jgi:hypothetical protein
VATRREVNVDPDGDGGWDLDIQVPDDARELERDIIAYHRELRALKRRRMLRRIMPAQAGVMPLIASILAVCLVAGAMLSVATFSPPMAPAEHHHPPTATATATSPQRASTRSAARASGSASPRPTASTGAASPSARSNPSSTTSHDRPPGGP